MEYGKHFRMFLSSIEICKKMDDSLSECFVVGRKDRNSEQFIILCLFFFFIRTFFTVTECAF